MVTRWTRNAFLWRYPLLALLFELVDNLIHYLGAHDFNYFPIGLALLLAWFLLLIGLPVFMVVLLVLRRFKLALAVAFAAVILFSPIWSNARVGQAFFKIADRIRYQVARDRYAAIVANMSPQERASTVVFFDWGGSGFLSTSLHYWVAYDESGEIARPDAERSQAWIERVRAQDGPIDINSDGCVTEAFRLSSHYYSVHTLCQPSFRKDP
jgi:hypothetical protein